MKKFLLILFSVVHCVLCVDVEAQTRRDGEFLFNEKRYEEAYGVYEKLMNRQPRDYTLKYLVGRCLFEMNRYEEASVLLESAARHDVLKANIWLYEIYFSQYRFVDAVDVLSVYMDQATLNAEQKEEYDAKLFKANLGASMLDRVEDIAIIDSVKMHKDIFLEAYRLSKDLGKLDLYYEVYGLKTPQPQVAYYTGRGDKMIFARENVGGDLDLNVSYRLVGGWSEAFSLSTILNTYEHENFPFELSDGVTLYFSSQGHNSIGGYDIFMTRYNSTINDYSEPINIGMPFNSTANDYMYVFDEIRNIAWFATDRFQHADTVVIYEILPNREKVLLKTDDLNQRREVAQLKQYRKAQLVTEDQSREALSIEEKESEINFFVNDGIIYTRMAQFKSEDAKGLYLKAQEADKRYLTLKRLLEGKRREFFFSNSEEDKEVLRKEILDLEVEIRKYKDLVEEYLLQTRREEIKAILINE
jgi:hypothetical protein